MDLHLDISGQAHNDNGCWWPRAGYMIVRMRMVQTRVFAGSRK